MPSVITGGDNLHSSFFARQWVNETGNREEGVTYTNTEQHPIDIVISVAIGTAAEAFCSISVDSGVVLVRSKSDASAAFASVSITIPVGSTYAVSITANNIIQSWGELK